MLNLILFLFFGSIMAYLAFQNSAHVTLVFFSYTFPNVSLFFVILGSMLIGVLLAYVIQLAGSISMILTLHGKDNKIKDSENNVTQLTKKTHQLELENESLKKEGQIANQDDQAL